MQTAHDLKGYRKDIAAALEDDFLRSAMDKFAVAYPASRAKAFDGFDVPALVAEIAAIKDANLARLDQLLDEFTRHAEAHGIQVHLAEDAAAANRIIAGIARRGEVRTIVKSKSMTAEETLLNGHLEAEGLEVVETDLGEWIIQLRHEGPSHMVMPAIHLSRYQVADLFSEVTRAKQDAEIERLVKVARRELRARFVEAGMGITGANFAVADTGAIGLTTNEGNARLVATLPRIHVALVGIDKLVGTLSEALRINQALPRNATGQKITSYVTWITGPVQCAAAPDGRKEMHVVFLDNGRRALARDPVFSQVLRCVRCGACANVCPVYRMVGGHRYGHIYIGAIGLILTYFFHGREKARNLVQNCINCGACKAVCAAGIDLPYLIKEIHARIQDEAGHPLESTLLGRVLANRRLFHRLLRVARLAQKPVTGGTPYIRHLPMIFSKEHNFRLLPAIAEVPFRDRWPALRPRVERPRWRVALFSGCVQDFVYPEQLEAGLKAMEGLGIQVDFPLGQSCCGLPVQMMGEKEAARRVAIQNMDAMAAENYDYIVTLCASCASHLAHGYPRLFAAEPELKQRAEAFAAKVIPFSAFLDRVVKVGPEVFQAKAIRTTYHAPCHLCRGMDEHEAPKVLLKTAGMDFVPAAEEETCCGFGGTYSSKFPRISAQILALKLADVEKTGAEILVTECPGCVMQLRGGAQKAGLPLEVLHIAEALAAARKAMI
ncbi:MAG: LUD domain-containing protein [Deltaproteobacteria bacterium]|nr:LUD domain-containing protein [Deltaproteobacteria bacterium]